MPIAIDPNTPGELIYCACNDEDYPDCDCGNTVARDGDLCIDCASGYHYGKPRPTVVGINRFGW